MLSGPLPSAYTPGAPCPISITPTPNLPPIMPYTLSTKREARIMLPTSIANAHNDTRYSGLLCGYYVANTNYYNIPPADAHLNASRLRPVGVVSAQPFAEAVPAAMHRALNLAKAEIDTSLTPEERIRQRKAHRATPEEQAEARQHLFNLLREADPAGAICHDAVPALLGFWDGDTLRLFQIDSLREVIIEKFALEMDVFSRNVGILENAVMMKKGALFIGCGSVGSLVAVELAKAGVGRFMLVDNDIFGYHNICRHQCGVYDVGRYKTDALEERILQINPYAEVRKFNCMIQEVDRGEIFSFCNPDTIVVGGADNREGDLYACDFALEIGMPFISIGCWERAFAGEVFYCLPQGHVTYKGFLDAVGYESGRVTQNRRFYTTEEDLAKVSFEPGISADINFVTIVAVKMILDLLNRDTPGYVQRLLPSLTQYTLICNTNNPEVGGEQAEIFSYPLQVTTSIYID